MAACGKDFTVAVDEHGEVWYFGQRGASLGQRGAPLGHGDDELQPARVGGHEQFGALVVLVATADLHCAAVAADGSLHTWGDAGFGQLGHGDLTVRTRPERLGTELFGGSRAVHVACGKRHTIIVTAAGRVLTCGKGRNGRLGHGDVSDRWTLTHVEANFGGAQIVYVTAGRAHTAVVGADGSAWTWGKGVHGGLGHSDDQDRLVPTKLALASVVMVAGGDSYTAAVADDGSLFTWGYGALGQLGLGDKNSRWTPVKVDAETFGNSPVLTVACGYYHTLAVTEDGATYSFGDGEDDKLGHNDHNTRLVPTRIDMQHFGDTKIVSVSASQFHSSAVTTDGAIFTWGFGRGYEEDDKPDARVPRRVALPGIRVGSCHGLRPEFALAFAMGTHLRLGAAGPRRQSRRQQGQVPAVTDGCVYADMPTELVRRVVDACVSLPEGTSGELEGVVRLLGGDISKLRIST